MLGATTGSNAKAMPATPVDPFAALTVEDWRIVAKRLDVPRQVVSALRERRVSLVSIPRGFLSILAEAMRCSVAQLESSWGSTQLAGVRSYKADSKPMVGEQVPFEQVLIDAGVPPERRARLMEGAN